MKEVTGWVCEGCRMYFSDMERCKEHEKDCDKYKVCQFKKENDLHLVECCLNCKNFVYVRQLATGNMRDVYGCRLIEENNEEMSRLLWMNKNACKCNKYQRREEN